MRDRHREREEKEKEKKNTRSGTNVKDFSSIGWCGCGGCGGWLARRREKGIFDFKRVFEGGRRGSTLAREEEGREVILMALQVFRLKFLALVKILG